VYEGIVECVKKYVTLVTNKNPFGMVRVDIMKTEDAIRIMEINEPDAFVVSSIMYFRRYPISIGHAWQTLRPNRCLPMRVRKECVQSGFCCSLRY
jgi:hypothetical protein